jgi:hypothetical protein
MHVYVVRDWNTNATSVLHDHDEHNNLDKHDNNAPSGNDDDLRLLDHDDRRSVDYDYHWAGLHQRLRLGCKSVRKMDVAHE